MVFAALTGTAAVLLGTIAPADPPSADVAPLRSFVDDVCPLPRYEERDYHPLGRSPVVDAVLADPAYIVTYARTASAAMRRASETGSSLAVLDAALRAGGAPISAGAPAARTSGGLGLPASWDAQSVRAVEAAWAHFLEARRLATHALAPMPESDREWFRTHSDSYFFGDESAETNLFWTANVDHILRIFAKCARIDLVELAEAGRCLAAASDEIMHAREGLLKCALDKPFRVERDGAVLLISGPGSDRHTEDVEFLLDLGGNDSYANNAGGTAGRMPASIAIDLAGNDLYDGAFATQGGGFLGAGCLVDAAGDDVYRAGEFAQAGAWIGAGMLHDLSGSDRYIGSYFVQGAAAFGFSVLCDRDGNDEYHADGMAQAGASTLGCAFLLDSRGNDRYFAGGPRSDRFTKAYSGAQGGAIGVRDYPWTRRPSFYAGLAFFDDAAGDDELYAVAESQGGAYFLGAAIHVNTGGNDRYVSSDDSLGGSIHLGAALCLKEGGNDTYQNPSSSLGIGGDRGTGVFIDTGGNDRYTTVAHCLGSARKPFGYGLFIDLAGDDAYSYGERSISELLRPGDPMSWPQALFADLDGRDTYSAVVPLTDGLERGDDRTWNFEGHARGVDTTAKVSNVEFFGWFPKSPRGHAPFDPINGWEGNEAFRPLIADGWPAGIDAESLSTKVVASGEAAGGESAGGAPSPEAQSAVRGWIEAIPRSGYDGRRRLYERLDLLRSVAEKSVDWSVVAELLRDPEKKPADQLAFAATWCTLDKVGSAVPLVAAAMKGNGVQSAYARGLLTRMVGEIDDPAAIDILKDRLAHDEDETCRRYAAFYLARRTPADTQTIRSAISDKSESVRWSVCQGLRDCAVPECAPLLATPMRDPSVFVRRQAALASISLGDKGAVDQLLEDLKIASLDTGNNYGNNIYADLAPYMGDRLDEAKTKELGESLEKWVEWWQQNRVDIVLARKPRPW
jgi:HEAT repeat protein